MEIRFICRLGKLERLIVQSVDVKAPLREGLPKVGENIEYVQTPEFCGGAFGRKVFYLHAVL